MPSEFAIQRIVEFAETDMAGLMHFSNYFRWMEACEAAFYRSLGLPLEVYADPGVMAWPRVKVDCQYQAPLHFNDSVDVRLFVKRLGEKSITYLFRFRRAGVLTAQGEMTLVCVAVDRTASGVLTARPLPDILRAKLEMAPDSAYAAN
ncbi:MAG TPA: thioesterase family protein [Candidatus Didemnitutus sp.]|jgi:YbgC/YbaW family acyl-CoA thioester hydrolase